MKRRKLLQRLKVFLDADRRAQMQQADAIKEVLHKLKKKETHLKHKLAQHPSEAEQAKLEAKLAVCHAQRKKGLAILKKIRAGNNAAS